MKNTDTQTAKEIDQFIYDMKVAFRDIIVPTLNSDEGMLAFLNENSSFTYPAISMLEQKKITLFREFGLGPHLLIQMAEDLNYKLFSETIERLHPNLNEHFLITHDYSTTIREHIGDIKYMTTTGAIYKAIDAFLNLLSKYDSAWKLRESENIQYSTNAFNNALKAFNISADDISTLDGLEYEYWPNLDQSKLPLLTDGTLKPSPTDIVKANKDFKLIFNEKYSALIESLSKRIEIIKHEPPCSLYYFSLILDERALKGLLIASSPIEFERKFLLEYYVKTKNMMAFIKLLFNEEYQKKVRESELLQKESLALQQHLLQVHESARPQYEEAELSIFEGFKYLLDTRYVNDRF